MTREQPTALVIRPRVDADMPALIELLGKQQAASEYPVQWPLPFPVVEFLKRKTEQNAWVAELHGQVVGHIAVTVVDETDADSASHLAKLWIDGHGGVPSQHQLRLIGVFFTDLELSGNGVGHHLLETATRTAWESGYPVLDVIDNHPGPIRFYERRGWKIVGKDRVYWDPTQVRYAYAMVHERDEA